MTISRSSEAQFWLWFQANEEDLFHFERQQEQVFDALAKALSHVQEDLTFEFGPVRDGKREFVISAGGIKAAFTAVEALFAAAPPLSRWAWTKFRPRRATVSDIEFGGKKVEADEVRYVLARDGNKIGILLFFPGFREEEKADFGQIGFLMLDEALGELSVETQVGFIDFMGEESRYFERSSPLSQLPTHFDEVWHSLAQHR